MAEAEMENPTETDKLMRNAQSVKVLLLPLLWPSPHKDILWTGTGFLAELQIGAQSIHFKCERKHEMTMLRALGRGKQNTDGARNCHTE